MFASTCVRLVALIFYGGKVEDFYIFIYIEIQWSLGFICLVLVGGDFLYRFYHGIPRPSCEFHHHLGEQVWWFNLFQALVSSRKIPGVGLNHPSPNLTPNHLKPHPCPCLQPRTPHGRHLPVLSIG